jgi:uncharacterized protein
MTPEEQELVEELFDRLAKLENGPRDAAAERVIADGLNRAPHAVYTLVQTALVQDEALKRANARIEELQAQTSGESQQQGGFLDSVRDEILGKRDLRGSVPSVRSQAQSSTPTVPSYRRQSEYPSQMPPYPPGPGAAPGMSPAFGSGGSFLGTAASTAAGVIGGGLLLNSIRSMFGDHAALGGHQRSALGSSGGSATASDLAQKDRDQDQDQDQDDQERERESPAQKRRIRTRIKTKIRMMTAAILAGTIPITRKISSPYEIAARIHFAFLR